VVFVFASINVLYYIYWFAYVEPPLHSWDKGCTVKSRITRWCGNNVQSMFFFLICEAGNRTQGFGHARQALTFELHSQCCLTLQWIAPTSPQKSVVFQSFALPTAVYEGFNFTTSFQHLLFIIFCLDHGLPSKCKVVSHGFDLCLHFS
jgi:hypothetical protein